MAAPLVEISALAVAWLCIQLALLIAVIILAVVEVIAAIPVIGNTLAGPVKSVAGAISGALYEAEKQVDSAIGASWHALAVFMRAWWHEIESQALTDLHLAEAIASLIYAHSGLSSLVRYLEHRFHGIEHGIRMLEREWHGIEARIKQLERGAGHGIDVVARDLAQEALKEYKGIDQLVTTTIPNEIAYAEAQTAALGRFIGAIPGVDYLTWANGLLAAVIGLDVLNGLKCLNLGNLFRKFGCGVGQLLNDLFGLMISLIALEAVCEYLPIVEGAFGAVVGPIVHLLNEVPLGECEIPPQDWASLSVDYGPLPPPQKLGQLAA